VGNDGEAPTAQLVRPDPDAPHIVLTETTSFRAHTLTKSTTRLKAVALCLVALAGVLCLAMPFWGTSGQFSAIMDLIGSRYAVRLAGASRFDTCAR
jgi:hypothetical protein